MIDAERSALTTTAEAIPPGIVIVEEDPKLREDWKHLLHWAGCSVHFAESTDAGEAVLAHNRIDIVVAPSRMSGKDGRTFLRDVRDRFPETIRVLTASEADKPAALEAVAAGEVQQFVLVPWNHEELSHLITQTIRLQRDVRINRVRATLRSFPSIPVPSKFYMELQDLLSKRDVSVQLLIRPIERNPSLVARILQVANSVHFWTRAAVTTVSEALNLIGTQYLHTLIMGIEMFENVMKNAPPEAVERYEDVWKRALSRSIIARQIALPSRATVNPGHAHVASLLQDVGLMLRLCSDPQKYLAMEKLAHEDGGGMYDAEWRMFGTTHDHLGAALLELWNFPPPVIVAVANQHWETLGDALTGIVQVADALTTTDPHHRHDPAVDTLIAFWRERLDLYLVGIQNSAPPETPGEMTPRDVAA